MLKKKYNGDEIQNKQIKKLYNIAKSVAIPKKINEQICFVFASFIFKSEYSFAFSSFAFK